MKNKNYMVIDQLFCYYLHTYQ